MSDSIRYYVRSNADIIGALKEHYKLPWDADVQINRNLRQAKVFRGRTTDTYEIPADWDLS